MQTRFDRTAKEAVVTESTDITTESGMQLCELVSAMDEVAHSSAVPCCIERALFFLSRQLSLLPEEKDKRIRELENQSSRRKINVLECSMETVDSSLS